MKKQLLLVTLLFSFFAASAQFKVIDKKDTVIKDGHVYTFNEYGGFEEDDDWYVQLKVKNESDKPIFIQLICDDLINTDGESFQMCMGNLCMPFVEKGRRYPDTTEYVELSPGAIEKISMRNSVENQDVKKWVFRIQEFDSNDPVSKEIGESVSFTYAFDPNLSINETQLEDVSIYPTIVESEFIVSSKENLSFSMYDLTGRKVKQSEITSRKQKVYIADLASQPYLVRFTNNKGQSLVKKIIVK